MTIRQYLGQGQQNGCEQYKEREQQIRFDPYAVNSLPTKRHSVTDIVSPAVRSRMMASIRSRDTKPEMTVRRHLHGLGFRYRLSPRELPGRPDLVLPRYKATIFVHGCFWHGHSSCKLAKLPSTNVEFWTEKISANRKRDAAMVAKLRALGWRVAVIWECALRSNPDDTLRQVSEFIASDKAMIEVAG